MRRDHEDEYEAFVRDHRGELLATALHLTGDPHLAEDLVQTALVRLYVAWGRVRRMNVGGYARRTLVNCFIDHRRRPWVRREHNADTVPDRPAVASAAPVDADLVAALLALPPRMRAVVVLRHVEDRSVEEVAEVLGCSTGNVKSQTARALDKLRAQLSLNPPLERNQS
ncbi:SigE family RNA polymerase sigma factor [Nocardioides ultimimeridianus]